MSFLPSYFSEIRCVIPVDTEHAADRYTEKLSNFRILS